MKVVYIAGYGRSGSTLLGARLAQTPRVCFAGELTLIWGSGFRHNRLCSCGRAFFDCAYWQEVVRLAFGADGTTIAAQALGQKLALEHMRHLPHMLAPSAISHRFLSNFRDYLDILSALYCAIQEVSGCDVIVDSSKIPTYLATLSHLEDIDLNVAHLVRDSRAVAYSWRRRKPRHDTHKPQDMSVRAFRQSAMEWNTKNALTHGVRTRARSYGRYRYEDLVCDLPTEMARLANQTRMPNMYGLPASASSSEIHCLNVNPSIFKPDFTRIRPDVEWETEMDAHGRRLVTAYTFPLLLAYGYRL